MYPTSARSTAIGSNNNFGANQTRSSANQGTMPSPPVQQGLGKGLKTSSNIDPLRQLNLNQQQSSRPFSQQTASGQVDERRIRNRRPHGQPRHEIRARPKSLGPFQSRQTAVVLAVVSKSSSTHPDQEGKPVGMMRKNKLPVASC